MGRSLVILFLAMFLMPVAASAEETSTEAAAEWSNLTVSVGLQMWRPMYASIGSRSGADPDAEETTFVEVRELPTIGGVLKVNYAFNDVVGMHVRGTYGVHSSTVPDRNASGSAFAAGLGVDFHHTITDRVLWSNTMGLAYGQSKGTFKADDEGELTSIGAYFITTFDVTVFGSMGVWMDWGCQVVGPSFGDTPAGDVTYYHINPLGAGGMRISF